MTSKRIVEWSLEYEGCDHAQYFQGVGVAFTKWDEVYLGAGGTPHEAALDALESAAVSGGETDAIPDPSLADFPDDPDPITDPEEWTEDFSYEDWYHYAALYVRYAEDAS